MSDLETAVRPLLIPLISDPHKLMDLSAGQRKIVARWAFKTAAVLNRASSYGKIGRPNARPVPGEHLAVLREGAIPERVLILGSGYSSQEKFDWLQYAGWTFPKSSAPLVPKDCNRSFKIAISLRDLVFIAAYYPSPEYCYAGDPSRFVRLHGSDADWKEWHGLRNEFVPRSLNAELEELLDGVSVLSRTWYELAHNLANFRLIR